MELPKIGDKVLVEEMGQIGEVKSLEGQKVRIKFGNGRGAPHRFSIAIVDVVEIEVVWKIKVLGLGEFSGKAIRKKKQVRFMRE